MSEKPTREGASPRSPSCAGHERAADTGKRWTIYVCPDCGEITSEWLWDATDREEKGLPACPHSDQHGQNEMRCVEVVPASRLAESERAREEAERERDAERAARGGARKESA